ncbi:MAG: helix-turn-helix transcriptional regulator [Proteobacteria bacterium]|nr:helix-turn-helix transcriptional regulator [Pseudomonadota bacterium]
MVSFSRDRPLSETAKRHHEPEVQLLATYFLSAAQHIFGEQNVPPESESIALTPREHECLTWAAIGKSSWEIGQVLGITEATVNFHLGNAATKLGVRGRILAVSKAIRLGLINPA